MAAHGELEGAGRQSEPKGRRLFLHIDRDSLVTIRKTGNKIFTGLSQGIVKVLKDPEMQKEESAPSILSSGSASEGEGDRTPTSSGYRWKEGVREEAPLASNLPYQNRGPL
jgi:hypothetical protein